MEILNPSEAFWDEDFLNFTLEGEPTMGGEENESKDSSSSLESKTTTSSHEMNSCSFSKPVEDEEEELEWLSNKDAFPAVETVFGVLSDNPQLVLNHRRRRRTDDAGVSPRSVSTLFFVGIKVPTNFPVRQRTKRQKRARQISADELPAQQSSPSFLAPSRRASSSTGRRCLHCQSEKTPQWRAGPMGPKTLCNACGVRYKSGRLLPEYRPAGSPTFCGALHSNSHRRVVEMRKQKEVVAGDGDGGGGGGEGSVVN